MKLLSLALISFLAQASAGGYNTRISGYAPGTDVVDHGNVDLDQAAMETAIKPKTEEAFAAGKVIYETGGNSKVSATVTLTAPLASGISSGTVLSGVGQDGLVLTAEASGTKGASTFSLKYAGGSCQMSVADKSKCFAESGTLTDGTTVYQYSSVATSAGRTLQGFSTAAGAKMASEELFLMFAKYYGQDDYADKLVQAAFSGGATDFTNGNADFSSMTLVGREQLVKKMSAYMNVLMYVIHELEASIGKCVDSTPYSNESAIHAWDEGVAFYSGYLSGETGSLGGSLIYALAEKRGGDFGTMVGDVSLVNSKLMTYFAEGRDRLDEANCSKAEKTMDKILSMIYIPVIQGALKYGYKTSLSRTDEKAVAEGIAFVQAVLPLVAAADEDAAATIYKNMGTGATTCDFAAVKKAFESVYDDVGIKCEQVGGYMDGTGEYYPGFEPCKTKACGNDKEKTFNYNMEKKLTCKDLKKRDDKKTVCASVTKARKQCAKACKAC